MTKKNSPEQPPFSDYKVGGKDNYGNTITEILFVSDNCMVYECNNAGTIRFEGKKSKTHQNCDPMLMEISTLLTNRSIRKRYLKRFAALFGALSLDNKKIATSLYNDLKKDIRIYKQIYGRLSYLSTAIGFAIFSVIPTLLFWFVPNTFSYTFNNFLSEALPLVSVAALSSLISISFNLRHYYIEPTVNQSLYVFSGFARMLVALACSCLGYILFRAEIVLSIFTKAEWGVYVVIAISAFNEKFIPSTLSKLEKTPDEKENADPA